MATLLLAICGAVLMGSNHSNTTQGINMVAGPITAARPDVKVHLDDPDMAVVANVFKVLLIQWQFLHKSAAHSPFRVRRLCRWGG
jgi:hypothetical protein